MAHAYSLAKGANVVVFGTDGDNLMQRLVYGATSFDDAIVKGFGSLLNDEGDPAVTHVLAVVPQFMITEAFERQVFESFLAWKYKRSAEYFASLDAIEA